MLWAQAEDAVNALRDNWVLLAVVAGLLVAGLVLLRIATSRKKAPPDLERGLREDLSTYPPPPAVGPRQASVDGIPGRVRLVVVAPAGKYQAAITTDDVPELLEEVVRRLGEVVRADKPRIRIWPAPLSVTGFAPTFHRLVKSPAAAGEPSRWVKLAGPARTGQRPVLLGLAIYADEPSRLGDLHLETTEWGELLRVAN